MFFLLLLTSLLPQSASGMCQTKLFPCLYRCSCAILPSCLPLPPKCSDETSPLSTDNLDLQDESAMIKEQMFRLKQGALL